MRRNSAEDAIERSRRLRKQYSLMLIHGIEYGNLSEVTTAINNNADVNYDGHLPLRLALRHNRVDMVTVLIVKGANGHIADTMVLDPKLRQALDSAMQTVERAR